MYIYFLKNSLFIHNNFLQLGWTVQLGLKLNQHLNIMVQGFVIKQLTLLLRFQIRPHIMWKKATNKTGEKIVKKDPIKLFPKIFQFSFLKII